MNVTNVLILYSFRALIFGLPLQALQYRKKEEEEKDLSCDLHHLLSIKTHIIKNFQKYSQFLLRLPEKKGDLLCFLLWATARLFT